MQRVHVTTTHRGRKQKNLLTVDGDEACLWEGGRGGVAGFDGGDEDADGNGLVEYELKNRSRRGAAEGQSFGSAPPESEWPEPDYDRRRCGAWQPSGTYVYSFPVGAEKIGARCTTIESSVTGLKSQVVQAGMLATLAARRAARVDTAAPSTAQLRGVWALYQYRIESDLGSTQKGE